MTNIYIVFMNIFLNRISIMVLAITMSKTFTAIKYTRTHKKLILGREICFDVRGEVEEFCFL